MTDIGTSVARDALRSGKATRMTEEMARQDMNLEFLAETLAQTINRRTEAEAFVRRQRQYETYLRALIERERVSPTSPPVDPPGPATPPDPATGSTSDPARTVQDRAGADAPAEHDLGGLLSGVPPHRPTPDGEGDRPATWPQS